MARQIPPWIRDILIIPLAVGIAVAFFGFILPKAFTAEKELSYSTEKPVIYLDAVATPGLKFSIGNQSLSKLVGYKVRIWNSGDVPLENLPVLVLFKGGGRELRIVSAAHFTLPSQEFGGIAERAPDMRSRRYAVELMNPGDVLEVAILANGSAEFEVFSKSHGMRLKRVLD